MLGGVLNWLEEPMEAILSRSKPLKYIASHTILFNVGLRHHIIPKSLGVL